MAIPVSNDTTAPLADNKTTRSTDNAAISTPPKQGTTPENTEPVISYADTADLSLAAKLLSSHTTAPASGPVSSSEQAAQLASAVRSAITGNGEQAIMAQAGNASPALVRLLGSE